MKYWYETLDKQFLEHCNTISKNIPDVKEIISTVFLSPKMKTLQFGSQIKYLTLQVDQSVRRDFAQVELSETYDKKIYELVNFHLSPHYEEFHKNKSEEKKEFIIGRTVTKIIKALIKQNHLDCQN